MIPESLWGTEGGTAVEQQAANETAAELRPAEELKPHVENETGQVETEEVAPPVALAVSVDDFSALEQRVLRAVEMLRHERQARAAAEVRIAEAEQSAAAANEQLGTLQSQLSLQTPLVEQLQSEIASLRAERDTVRHRVERLLEQLSSLEI